MKKISCLCLTLCLALLLCSCSSDSEPNNNNSTNTDPGTAATQPADDNNSDANTPEPANNDNNDANSNDNQGGGSAPAPEGATGLDFNSNVVDMEGTWNLSAVYVDGEELAPVSSDAIVMRITKELDPSELVDGPNYIHNQVYNLTGYLSFGISEIADTLAADDIEEYKGSTSWEDFPQGKVVDEGEFYEQPGPATMRFKDIDDYGLYLDQVAGASADVDTMEKTLIIGLNGNGQLLLGFSEDHIERPGTDGDWVYCLVFDKA